MKWGQHIYGDDDTYTRSDIDRYLKSVKSRRPKDYYNVSNFSNPYTVSLIKNRLGPYTKQDIINRNYLKKVNGKKLNALDEMEQLARETAKSIGDKVPDFIESFFLMSHIQK